MKLMLLPIYSDDCTKLKNNDMRTIPRARGLVPATRTPAVRTLAVQNEVESSVFGNLRHLVRGLRSP